MTDPRATRIIERLRQIGYYELARSVAEKSHVTVVQMVGRRKTKSHCAARHMLWHAIYVEGKLSFPEMAEMFESDNSTICKAVHKCMALDIAKPTANDDSGKAEVA